MAIADAFLSRPLSLPFHHLFPFCPLPISMAAAAASPRLTALSAAQNHSLIPRRAASATPNPRQSPRLRSSPLHFSPPPSRRDISCKATEVSLSEASPSPSSGGGEGNWVPVVPLAALPKGERRVIIQEGETILLLWYKDQVFAIENRSPAEGAYSEGLINAKLTQDGCIVCPTTDSTFDLRTGEIKEWYPNNPVLRVLTPSLRSLYVYPLKTDEQNIYIKMTGGAPSDASAEIVFSGTAQPGFTASDVNVEEVRMVVDDDVGGFGFTSRNESINGKAAVIGFLLLLDFELLTGEGSQRDRVLGLHILCLQRFQLEERDLIGVFWFWTRRPQDFKYSEIHSEGIR